MSRISKIVRIQIYVRIDEYALGKISKSKIDIKKSRVLQILMISTFFSTFLKQTIFSSWIEIIAEIFAIELFKMMNNIAYVIDSL